MSLAPPPPSSCRVCQAEVLATDLTCPHCGAPRPARAEFTGEGFEWRSTATWIGSPLIHVAFGMDADGRQRVARGVIAIGQRARGGIAIGLMASGFVAIGFVAIGVFSLGVVAVAGLAAVGVNAIAPWAVGVVALGYWAGGLAPLGWRILFARS
jgi:hypothetical protein